MDELYPGLSPDQQQQAQEILKRYFEIALAIVSQDLVKRPIQIDTARTVATMKERSNTNLKT